MLISSPKFFIFFEGTGQVKGLYRNLLKTKVRKPYKREKSFKQTTKETKEGNFKKQKKKQRKLKALLSAENLTVLNFIQLFHNTIVLALLMTANM
jgi:hypothetical protein